MPVVVPQRFVLQGIPLPIAAIRTLNSSPAVLVGAQTGFIYAFVSASLFYLYDTDPVANFNNLLYLKIGSYVVSTQLNASNLLGVRGSSYNYSPANPYSQLMSTTDNLDLKLCMDGSDPTGGGDNTQLLVNLTYDIFQKS
jgi:hypothetical protein